MSAPIIATRSHRLAHVDLYRPPNDTAVITNAFLDVSSSKQLPKSMYADAELCKHEIEDATFAVRIFGDGPAVVLIHGYPVHGYTWRKLLPTLSKNFRCYVVDLPGLGDSDWTPHTDFTFTAQARRLTELLSSLDIQKCSLIAHNTGATIARLVALRRNELVGKLAIINTEIPNHRPPWIQFYQLCAKLPIAKPVFRTLLKRQSFVRSSMGLGEFYSDKKLFDDVTNTDPYLVPLTSSPKRLSGMLGYLAGIDWQVVDSMKTEHKNIRADVLFLWGEDDKTFPVQLGAQMVEQFRSNCRFEHIVSASLMPQEEKPECILKHLVPFLSD